MVELKEPVPWPDVPRILHKTVRLLLAPVTLALRGMVDEGAVLTLLLPLMDTTGVDATVI